MKVRVREGKCQGHARCNAVAPAIFELDDEGYVLSGDIEVPAGQEELARRGVRACPERALEIVDESEATS